MVNFPYDFFSNSEKYRIPVKLLGFKWKYVQDIFSIS